ncbi:hypothetical protein ACT3XG_14800 [Paenibacillus polymyxa]|uniref:hypothetical protein n=1 Tax=Paenibacillus TaxID=44249 RepID=UPI00142D65CA|nr:MULTISPECIES: hypothetical protein [Paenibacillus]KAF6658892.1 hypothetical protein HFD99_01375 [Paenibacillus sp. EKM301P]UBS85425.1 hypothetical protein LAZ93_14755 [Paenibacillus polymyxa]WHX33944.1 hypothetical protein QNH38_15235 [Paenibacillus polymyxa]
MIRLYSEVFVITAITRKTSAETFRDWRVGDRIRFSTVMKAMAGASGGGVYASMYRAENLTQETSTTKSQTNMNNVISAFEMRPESEVTAE